LTSEIKTLGGGTYFSDSFNTDDPYGISINLSQAENVTFTASYGGGFESNTVSWTTDIGPEGVEHEFVLPTIIDPEDAGWYAVDNHQHSDYGDGSTRIEDLFNAQIAAKLDYALVSDHDALAHNAEMADFAANHEPPIPFLSNLEVSPGWGHWGLLGIPIDDTYDIDPSATTPQEIIEYGHDAGTVVIVHHPYSDYGFLNNQASVNGGTDVGWDGFDLLELQSTINLDGFADALADGADSISLSNLKGSIRDLGITNMDAMALASAFAFWNNGQEIYLSAGSDQHDAASSTLYPGIIREYALLEEPTVENYLTALTNGEAYVTMGPILQPKLETTLFGSTHEVVVGEQYVLRLDAGSVNGATEITLWANGTPVATQSVGAISNGALQTASFTVTPFVTGDEENVWYSFTATDAAGKIAVSNPLWFELTDTSATTNLDGQVFTLTPEHAPTKSLDVKGGSTLAGAEIILYDSKHTANQHFRFEYNEANGTYTIVAVVSGQVLDVYGASATSGAKVIQWPAKATNNLNQQWIVEPAIGEDGYIIVSALNPDLMLDVSGSSTANGTSLILWNRHERPNQVFTLTPPDSSLDGSSFAIHTIAGTTDRVLDIYGKGIKGGERLILWSPNSQANQIFSFDYDETTGFYIITAEHSGQVLDIYGGSVNAGASVIQWPTKTSGNIFNQRWTVEEVRGGFIIKSAITGYALTVNGGLNAAGANLVAQPYRGTATQIWDLEG
ncbi:MAG: CehA/McbA family metallohydrolase, partial [Coriobacteriales bacterium]|nr:CehA/McbA family metallohydrolase [Coriobacteriales bacterium]